MRLAAVYIPENSLPHIFGEDHKGQTINFGGRYNYSIEYKNRIDKADSFINIKRNQKDSFIENFFGEKISLITALVGQNGSGKTTILKHIKSTNKKTFFIYEHLNSTYLDFKGNNFIFQIEEHFNNLLKINFDMNNLYHNDRILLEIEENNDFPDNSIKDISNIKYLYYSVFSNFDQDLKSLDDFIVKNHDNDIISIKNSIRLRQINFLYNFKLINKLKDHFKDFPFYDSLSINLDDKLIIQHQNHDDVILKSVYNSDKQYFHELYQIYRNAESVELRIFISLYYRFLFSFLGNSNSSIAKAISKIENIIDEQIILIKNNSISPIIFNDFINGFKKSVEFNNLNFDDALKFLNIDINNFLGVKTFNDVDFNSLKDFLNSYSTFLSMFERNNRDNKINNSLLGFLKIKPNKNLSLGEESLLNFFSSLYENTKELDDITTLILLLDEPELGFHPEWKKKFINSIIRVLPELYNELKPNIKNVQIIFSTHDPLTLSDIPNSSVVYLKKEGEYSKILKEEDLDRPQKTFGANIHELLADSFFVEDGLIGEFAKNKIAITLSWLKIKANELNELSKGEKFIYEIDSTIDIPKFENKEEEFNYHRQIIELIDEPLVKNKLKEMFIEYANDKSQFLNYELEKAKQKVQELEERLKNA